MPRRPSRTVSPAAARFAALAAGTFTIAEALNDWSHVLWLAAAVAQFFGL